MELFDLTGLLAGRRGKEMDGLANILSMGQVVSLLMTKILRSRDFLSQETLDATITLFKKLADDGVETAYCVKFAELAKKVFYEGDVNAPLLLAAPEMDVFYDVVDFPNPHENKRV